MESSSWALILGVIVSLFLSTGLHGETKLPKEASAKIFEYEVLLAELEAPLSELDGHYVAKLNSVKESVREQGNLDGMLMVEKEIEAIQAKDYGAFLELAGPPKSLVEAREIFDGARMKLDESLVPSREKLRWELIALLEEFQIGLTQEGRLDEAVLLKDFIDRLKEKAGERLQTSARTGFSSASAPKSVTLRMQVDGMTHLMIKGDEVWYDHSRGWAKAIGLHSGVFPTEIDGREWMPVWEGKTTQPYDAAVGLPKVGDIELKIEVLEGRGTADVVEHPASGNGYTAKIAVKDQSESGQKFGGSAWLEIRISW